MPNLWKVSDAGGIDTTLLKGGVKENLNLRQGIGLYSQIITNDGQNGELENASFECKDEKEKVKYKLRSTDYRNCRIAANNSAELPTNPFITTFLLKKGSNAHHHGVNGDPSELTMEESKKAQKCKNKLINVL